MTDQTRKVVTIRPDGTVKPPMQYGDAVWRCLPDGSYEAGHVAGSCRLTGRLHFVGGAGRKQLLVPRNELTPRGTTGAQPAAGSRAPHRRHRRVATPLEAIKIAFEVADVQADSYEDAARSVRATLASVGYRVVPLATGGSHG